MKKLEKKRNSIISVLLSILMFLTMLCVGMASSSSEAIAIAPSGFTLSYADEFDGTSLDTSKWGYRTNSGCIPENVSVSGGNLVLSMTKDDQGDYYGGGIITKETFKYGYYETRAKLYNGPGFHPAFWTAAWDGQYPMPEDYYTGPRIEIDFFENDGPTNFHTGVIKWHPGYESRGRTYTSTGNLSEDFHVWGAEFTPEYVYFYFDGQLVNTVSVADFPHNEQFVWLTVIKSGTPDDSKLPGEIYYDYFRYYTKDEGYGEPVEVIVDNTDSQCTFDSQWTTSTNASDYHYRNYAHDGSSGTDAAKWVKWTPDIAVAGDYDIYMKFPVGNTSRPDAAPVEIMAGTVLDSSKTVNQQTDGGQWNYLGRYDLTEGTDNYVKLLASDAGYTIADAVKFAYVPSSYLSDDFEDGNSDGWTEVSGSWAVSSDGSNVYRQSSTYGISIAHAGDLTWTDYSYDVDLKMYNDGSSTGTGILARYSDSNNFYMLRLHSGLDQLQLYKKVNGSFSLLDSAPMTIDPNIWYNLRLDVTGDILTGYVDDVEMVTVTDSSLTAGCIGMRGYYQSFGIDNVNVK